MQDSHASSRGTISSRPARYGRHITERPIDHAATATRRWAPTLVLVLCSYIPALLTRPGKISADTKSYLTLDVSRLLGRAVSLWDPHVGAGTVTHQNIGYLFPLGPYYWVMDRLAVPDWITQRLWWGTLVFLAAYGTVRLMRYLGWSVAPTYVAAAAYAFSPYAFAYLARLSIILTPWVALPWLILLAARSVREGGWRRPAQFALVIALIGSINATSLVLVGIGPVAWVLTDLLYRRVNIRQVVTASLRIGALSAAVSMWWAVALLLEGKHGIPILRYTETYETVAAAATPTELLRGLGYWYFYGSDHSGAWVGPSATYLAAPMLALGLGIVAIGLLGLIREMRSRVHALALLVVGVGVAVGASPLSSPSPYGRVFAHVVRNGIGLALRSTPRAAPLLLLALAMGLASSTEWIQERFAARQSWLGAVGLRPALPLLALVAVQFAPWFALQSLTPSILRASALPTYWTADAKALDAAGTSRVYELPAADFASYRWGGTVDPVLPGIMDRPYLARELVPQGSPATANLVNAFERRLYEGWFEPATLLPYLRLLGIGAVNMRNDLEWERYMLARPSLYWPQIQQAGLGAPIYTGPTISDPTAGSVIDELTVSRPDAATSWPAVASYEVPGSPGLVSLRPAAATVVAGDGDGLVDLAGAQLLDPNRIVLYSGAESPAGADSAPGSAAAAQPLPGLDSPSTWLVVSDTNRRQAVRWSTVGADLGALEQPGDDAVSTHDVTDNRLDVFPDNDALRTVAELRGGIAAVTASSYGNPFSFTAEDAPVHAVDGDPRTAWRAGAFSAAVGQHLDISLTAPVAVDHITLMQPTEGVISRRITRVRITLDDSRSFDVDLDDSSYSAPGQQIPMPAVAFSRLRVTVDADTTGPLASYAAQPAVGIAELDVPGVTATEYARLPVRVLTDYPTAAAQGRLTILLTRQRIATATPNRADPEVRLQRAFTLPSARTFTIDGQVRLAGSAPDTTLERALWDGSGPSATSDQRVQGGAVHRGGAALDGNPATTWMTPFNASTGDTLHVHVGHAVTSGSLVMSWVGTGQSIPRIITVRAVDGASSTITLPTAATTVTVAVPDSTSGDYDIVLDTVEEHDVASYFSGLPIALPVAISEAVIDGSIQPITGDVSTTCRSDLLSVDGVAVAVRLVGARTDAIDDRALQMQPCGGPLSLAAGSHMVETADGFDTGWDVDRLVIDAATVSPPTAVAPAVPAITWNRIDADTVEATIPPTADATWLVFAESFNSGWHADGPGLADASPTLVDGYANGWMLAPSSSSRTVRLEWQPQKSVRLGIGVSIVGMVGVGALLVFAKRRPVLDPRLTHGVGRSRRPVALVGLALFGGIPALLAGGAVWWAGRRWPRIAGTVVVASVATVVAVIGVLQFHYDYPTGPDWPARFKTLGAVSWAAVAAAVMAPRRRVPVEVTPADEQPALNL